MHSSRLVHISIIEYCTSVSNEACTGISCKMEIIFCYFTLLIARYNTKTCSTKKVLTVVAIPVVGKIVSLLQLKTGEKTLNQPNKIALEDQFVSIQVFQKFLNVSFPL